MRITGVVQGVGYRYAAYQKARELNLCGIIRNQSDDSVFCDVEGDEQQLQDFIAWCRRGPRAARVESVSSEESNELKHYRTMSIV